LRLFALADTHLSLSGQKPMSRFGPEWWHHSEKILRRAWQTLGDEDVLLLPGDLSWATKRQQATLDLDFLAKLPGTKICIKGNHDFWWESDRPINHPPLLSPPVILGELGIAGTRGWDLSDERLLLRKRKRLEKSLAAISHCNTKICLLHYPPHPFLDLLEAASVSVCVYGHVHLGSFPEDEALVLNGEYLGTVLCHCVACDRIDFTPKQVWPPQ
jgi:uncharacterized protein